MSNYLAIATVTETLRQLLHEAVKDLISGFSASATAVRPVASTGGTPTGLANPGVNIFLYHVSPNPAGRNLDLPHRNGNGDLTRRPRTALDLHFLLSFYGSDTGLVTHRLLGRVVQTLHAQPVLTRQQVRSVVASSTFLAGSNLAEEVELVKFSPIALSLEELSKLWSVFFQTTYALSVAYQASVVLIEGDELTREPLPVLTRQLKVLPSLRPVIDGVSPQIIEPGKTLVIEGRNLSSDQIEVAFGEVSATPSTITNERIEIAVPAALTPGVHTVQVRQYLKLDAGVGTTVPHRIFESNVAAFVLAPKLTSAPAATIVRGQSLSLNVAPPVGRNQDVRLLLGSRMIALPPRPASDPATATQLSFPIPENFPTGSYLLRVGVEGAQSGVLTGTTSFTSPTIQITGGAHSLRSSIISLSAPSGLVKGVVTIVDETAATVSGTDVSVTWTLPGGIQLADVRKTNGSGLAEFQTDGSTKGTYVLTVSEITAKDKFFDQLGSTELTKSHVVS